MNNGLMGFPGLQNPPSQGNLPEFKVRAWINFLVSSNTYTIMGSGNVSSMTNISTGTHRVNLIVPMPDKNYAVLNQQQNMTTNISTQSCGIPTSTNYFDCYHVENSAEAQVSSPSMSILVR